jgi:hypothetical protein
MCESMVGTSMERAFVSCEKVCKSESKQCSGGGVSNWFWDIATDGQAVSYDSDEDEDQHSPLHLLKAA